MYQSVVLYKSRLDPCSTYREQKAMIEANNKYL